MPLTSSQIAQMNGSFGAQYMQNQQMAGMIQPPGYNLGGMNSGAQNEGMAAGMMNKGMAIGAPAAALGMGLMGLDPLSIGLKGAMGAHAMGAGVGGSIMAGASAAALPMAGMAAIGYMGNQMMTGARDTQQFNQNMRGSFSFFNPNAQGGRGFTESGIRQIGSDLRGMQGGHGGFGQQGMMGQEGKFLGDYQLGPSFAELGRLASGMGRMGMADGVRNAKEFTDKFKEMMKAVKVIAEDMGTTLEEAQKTMAAMKGSGVFKSQANVSRAIRGAGVAGGLATTEVTGMMNVGSQISRMFGGTGRQGAMGGIKAIEQVGSAVQLGALTEEDIYNTTGLTGAEGRRAMAQENMMQTGQFLKSAKGRWSLASLAGRNGQLDRDSVNELMTGSGSVGETRARAHKNLHGVGRANFIRNEGRLRGAAMEEFGGMLPAFQMMQWAQGKGIDVNSMGDREMLFMQRQLGMGRDEMDSAMKMVKALPDMLRQQREARQGDVSVRERGVRAQNTGLEGVKRRFEAAKDHINEKMQDVGSDILNAATDKIAEWGNKLADTYEERVIEGVQETHSAAKLTGKSSQLTSKSLIMDLGNLTGKKLDIAGPGENPKQVAERTRNQELQFAARSAMGAQMDPRLAKTIEDNKEQWQEIYAKDLSLVGGTKRMERFGKTIAGDKTMSAAWDKMDDRGRAAFMQQLEGQIGLKEGRLSETFKTDALPDLVGTGPRTEAQRKAMMGRAVLGTKSSSEKADEDLARAVKQDMHGGAAVVMGMGIAAGATTFAAIKKLFSGNMQDEYTGNAKAARAAGEMFDNKETRDLAFSVLRGNPGARGELRMLQSNLQAANAKPTWENNGKLAWMEGVGMSADLMQMTKDAGGDMDKISPENKEKLLEIRRSMAQKVGEDPSKIGWDDVKATYSGVREGALGTQREMNEAIAKQVGRDSREEARISEAGGIASLQQDINGWSLVKDNKKLQEIAKRDGSAVAQAMAQSLTVQDTGLQVGDAKTAEDRASRVESYESGKAGLSTTLSKMSVKDLRTYAKNTAGSSSAAEAAGMLMRGQAIEGHKRKRGGGGAAGAIAGTLGLDFSPDELQGLAKMGIDQQTAAIMKRGGFSETDQKFKTGIAESIAAAGKKGGGIQAAHLLDVAKAKASEDTKKKLTERAKGEPTGDDKIIEKIGEGNKFLEALVKSNKDALAKLGEISGNTKEGDGEHLYSKDKP